MEAHRDLARGGNERERGARVDLDGEHLRRRHERAVRWRGAAERAVPSMACTATSSSAFAALAERVREKPGAYASAAGEGVRCRASCLAAPWPETRLADRQAGFSGACAERSGARRAAAVAVDACGASGESAWRHPGSLRGEGVVSPSALLRDRSPIALPMACWPDSGALDVL